MRSSAVLALVLLAALGLGACGSSGPTAEDEVREAAKKALSSEDPKSFCKRLVSDRFVAEIFEGDDAACARSDVVEENPGEPRVSAIVLRGEDETRAEVAVGVADGKLAGVSGHLELVKEGERWKLDRFGEDYLRSNFLVAIEKTNDGAFAIEAMKRCVGGQVEKLPAARLRTISYDSVSDDAAFFDDLLTLSEKCDAALAEYGARELTDPLYETGRRTPRYIRCVRGEIEAFLLLTDVTPDLLGENPDEFAVATLEGIVTGAKKNCLKD